MSKTGLEDPHWKWLKLGFRLPRIYWGRNQIFGMNDSGQKWPKCDSGSSDEFEKINFVNIGESSYKLSKVPKTLVSNLCNAHFSISKTDARNNGDWPHWQ